MVSWLVCTSTVANGSNDKSLILDDETYIYSEADNAYYKDNQRVNERLNEQLKLLSTFMHPEEKINSIRPIEIGGKQYIIYYLFTGDIKDHEGVFLLPDACPPEIRASIILADGKLVTDLDTLHQIYTTALARIKYSQASEFYGDVYIHEQYIKDINQFKSDPVVAAIFLEQEAKSLLKGDEVIYTQLLRKIVTERVREVLPNPVMETLRESKQTAEDLETVLKTVQEIAKVGEYSNNRVIRKTLQRLSKNLERWRFVKEGNNRYLKIAGQKIPWTAADELLELAILVTQQQVYDDEQIEMLENVLMFAEKNNIQLNSAFSKALSSVIREAKYENEQLWNKLEEFAVEKVNEAGVEAALDFGLKSFSKWVFRSRPGWGPNSFIGHGLLGAAYGALVGFSISNIIYSMDSIYEFSVYADYSQKISLEFDKILKALIQGRTEGNKYDVDNAMVLRSVTLLKADARARFLDYYGAIIDSAELIRTLKDLISGGQLSEKAASLHQQARDARDDWNRRYMSPCIERMIASLSEIWHTETCPPKGALSLQEAAEKGFIQLESKGGYTGDQVTLIATGKNTKDITVVACPGDVLLPKSIPGTKQTLVVSKYDETRIPANTPADTILKRGEHIFCIDAEGSGPQAGERLDVGPNLRDWPQPEAKKLLQLLAVISRKGLYESELAQRAIWAVTNAQIPSSTDMEVRNLLSEAGIDPDKDITYFPVLENPNRESPNSGLVPLRFASYPSWLTVLGLGLLVCAVFLTGTTLVISRRWRLD